METSADITRNLEAYLREIIKVTSSIVAVYLFGSYANNKGKTISDLDLAFLLDEKTYNADSFEAARYAYMASMRAGIRFRKETDVVILNSSSIELAYEVVVTGHCVYEEDQSRRLEYEAVIRGMYYDFKPFLTELRSRFLEKL